MGLLDDTAISVVTIKGNKYRYAYDKSTGKMMYLGPVGDAKELSEVQFLKEFYAKMAGAKRGELAEMKMDYRLDREKPSIEDITRSDASTDSKEIARKLMDAEWDIEEDISILQFRYVELGDFDDVYNSISQTFMGEGYEWNPDTGQYIFKTSLTTLAHMVHDEVRALGGDPKDVIKVGVISQKFGEPPTVRDVGPPWWPNERIVIYESEEVDDED